MVKGSENPRGAGEKDGRCGDWPGNFPKATLTVRAKFSDGPTCKSRTLRSRYCWSICKVYSTDYFTVYISGLGGYNYQKHCDLAIVVKFMDLVEAHTNFSMSSTSHITWNLS